MNHGLNLVALSQAMYVSIVSFGNYWLWCHFSLYVCVVDHLNTLLTGC